MYNLPAAASGRAKRLASVPASNFTRLSCRTTQRQSRWAIWIKKKTKAAVSIPMHPSLFTSGMCNTLEKLKR